ncbi:CBS domain-containing protein [Bacillus alkalicellulosilyticus]|uniref:CBS domain-containing protein n=1 Tax=Alkalihalobacterium alkalicellulosilyticum TaxID=1912214 RepID=UPI000998D201|nr:CBS domain-containing protein [Bacillus alkalicellulosilyticus]
MTYVKIKHKKTQSELAERFEVAFNQIHEVLKRLNQFETNDAFMKLLTDTSNKHNYIRSFYYDLRQFAKLRNALVHEKFKKKTYIATPHEETVRSIERIARLLKQPITVMNIATSNVLTLQMEMTIDQVIQTMNNSEYNQYPVYQNGSFSFLLTDGGLTKWLGTMLTQESIQFSSYTTADIQLHEKDHVVEFVPQSMNIFELEDLFEELFQDGRKLEAVIVTENGSPAEQPLGIVTAWDLIEIDLLTNRIS